MVGTLIEPLVAALLAAALFSQAMTPRQWAGALLLAGAMLLLVRRSKPAQSD